MGFICGLRGGVGSCYFALTVKVGSEFFLLLLLFLGEGSFEFWARGWC